MAKKTKNDNDWSEAIEAYNKERPHNETHEAKFAEIIEALGWTASDGDIPGVWRDKPLGSRAVWSCVWSTWGGLLRPENYRPIESLSVEELRAELADAAFGLKAEIFALECARTLLMLHNNAFGDSLDHWLHLARAALERARQGYEEFTSAWDPPSVDGPRRVWSVKYRPGWERAARRRQREPFIPETPARAPLMTRLGLIKGDD